MRMDFKLFFTSITPFLFDPFNNEYNKNGID